VCAWFNRSQYIEESIGSLLNQTYSNFEVIVVNDGSVDPMVKQIFDNYHDHRLIVIHQENTGFTKAIRRAIELSDGDCIAIHGAGDISVKERLEQLVSALLSTNSSAVGSGCTQVAASKGIRRRYFSPQKKCTTSSLVMNMPFVHGTAMFTRKAYISSGGYDTRFKYCADWDLFFRLVLEGDIIGIDKPLYEQRMFDDGFSFSPEHKFKQLWYRERATNRSEVSRSLLDDAEIIVSSIRPEDIKYLRYSLIFTLKSLVKSDFVNAYQWFRLVCKQLYLSLIGRA
jgi:glycosyltransferase involved in cell wall biosynthesis